MHTFLVITFLLQFFTFIENSGDFFFSPTISLSFSVCILFPLKRKKLTSIVLLISHQSKKYNKLNNAINFGQLGGKKIFWTAVAFFKNGHKICFLFLVQKQKLKICPVFGILTLALNERKVDGPYTDQNQIIRTPIGFHSGKDKAILLLELHASV